MAAVTICSDFRAHEEESCHCFHLFPFNLSWSDGAGSVQFISVQSLSCVWLFETPWTAALQASLSITNSWSLLKLIHRVGDAIQPAHPLSSPSPPAFNLSQHQGIFQWVSSLHQVAKVLEFQLQHQSFQSISRTDFLYDWLVGSPCSPRDSQESSPKPQFKASILQWLSFLYGPTLMTTGKTIA